MFVVGHNENTILFDGAKLYTVPKNDFSELKQPDDCQITVGSEVLVRNGKTGEVLLTKVWNDHNLLRGPDMLWFAVLERGDKKNTVTWYPEFLLQEITDGTDLILTTLKEDEKVTEGKVKTKTQKPAETKIKIKNRKHFETLSLNTKLAGFTVAAIILISFLRN